MTDGNGDLRLIEKEEEERKKSRVSLVIYSRNRSHHTLKSVNQHYDEEKI